ncbi:MAG TPA: RNA 2',3'-cyclic phosphodiesterase [Candidatus Thermoplasmatota archaeon]|nr:RNA 2',3'-cyclic phosphodiesterase [Candidatus Thermoplasmatota archaeon]
MAFRAFVAVAVPPEPSLVALLDELARLRADVTPVDAAQLHFTLSFLGQVADEAQPALAAAVAEAARGARRFALRLLHVGAFPNVRHPRVVWVGVEDPGPISTLAIRVRAELAARGYSGDDKDFRAHLTLARVRSPQAADELSTFLRRHGADVFHETPVESVSLYRSTPGPHGPRYEALATAALEA